MSDENIPVKRIVWVVCWSWNKDDLVGLLIAKPKPTQIIVLGIMRANFALGTSNGHDCRWQLSFEPSTVCSTCREVVKHAVEYSACQAMI